MKIELNVTSAMVPPAVSITDLMVSSTCRVCAATLPTCTTLLSLSNANVPETYTIPSAMVPGENGAMGAVVPGGTTTVLGMGTPHVLEVGAAWPIAPQKSATVETQPKNFSILYSAACWTKSGPAWCVASSSTTAKYSRWN